MTEVNNIQYQPQARDIYNFHSRSFMGVGEIGALNILISISEKLTEEVNTIVQDQTVYALDLKDINDAIERKQNEMNKTYYRA